MVLRKIVRNLKRHSRGSLTPDFDPKHRAKRARASKQHRPCRHSETMASLPDAVPDEVQAALSGMMEQLAAISAAPTEAEREQQYDVLAGMLAAATEASTSTPPPSMLATATEAAATASPGSSSPGSSSSLAAATTQAGPAASEGASNGTAKPTRTAKSSHVAQQKIEAAARAAELCARLTDEASAIAALSTDGWLDTSLLGSALPGGTSAVADGTAVAVAVAGGASGFEDGAHGLDGSKPFALPVRIEVAGLTAEQAVEQGLTLALA